MSDAVKKEKIRQGYLTLAKNKKITADTSDLDTQQKQDVEDINKIDPSLLTSDELKEYIRIVDRINENGDFGNSGKLAAIGKAQEGWKHLSKQDTHTLNLTELEQLMDSQPMAIEAIFGLPKQAALFQLDSGIKGMNEAAAISSREAESFAEMLNTLQKKPTDESLYRQGIYQELIRQPESMEPDEALSINKELIESTIQKKRNAGNVKEADIDAKFFKPFEKATTMDEVHQIMESIDPAGKKVIEAMIDYHENHKLEETGQTFLETLASDNERFENKEIEKVHNYAAPRAWKKIGRGEKVDFNDITEFNPAIAKNPKPKQIKSGMSLSMRDREGAVLDFNVHKNAVDNIQKSLLRALTKPYQYQIRNFIKNEAALQKLFGLEQGNPESIKRTNNMIDAIFNENSGTFFTFERDLLNNGRPDTNKFVKAFASAMNGLKKVGYSISLSGVTQAPKQATVLANVAIQLGKDAGLIAESVSDAHQNAEDFRKFFRGETVDMRGESNALLNVGKFYNASDRLEAESKLTKFFSNTLPRRTEKRFRSKVGGAGILTSTDVSVAKTSFLAFYKQYLKQNGIEYQGLAKETELKNERIRKEARAFAKQRVDTLQVVSNPAEQSKFFKEKGILPEVARAWFVPYGGFAASSKTRLWNDYKALATGNSEQRKAARRDITATFVEQATFSTVSQGLKLAMYGAVGLGLRSMLGLDDEESWDEWWAKTKKIVAKDMLFSNLPVILGTPGEDGLVDMINYSYFNFLKQGEPDLTEKEYEKDHAPLVRYKNYDKGWWDYLGPYGASTAKMADIFQLLDKSNDPNLSKDQQNLAIISAMTLAGQLQGYIPADIANAVKGEFNKQKAAAKENSTNPRNTPRLKRRPRLIRHRI